MHSRQSAKLPSGGRIVVAMSGGVDSSVTAALMVEAGYDVIGMTLQLYDHGTSIGRKGACCAGQDIYDASQVAQRLGIPHYVLDYESVFSQAVMEEFADSYVAGETPVPCIRCNQRVKFRDLLGEARTLGAEALATGHYVRRVSGPGGGVELHRGSDHRRDQSYFLFTTTADQLDFLRFPLGELDKDQTRAIAVRHGLSVADKPDSQDICFVPDGDYTAVVRRMRPDSAQPGEIRHLDGRLLGHHRGILHYTVGQRRGLGVYETGSGNEPLYVVRIDATRHRVIVGPRRALAVSSVHLNEVNWLGDAMRQEQTVAVKIRSMGAPLGARLHHGSDGRARVDFDEPQLGVAPGQACVFYDGTRLLGGGWIEKRDHAFSA
ncbi:MAG TPA: tRNA 2-thiouridine(34) synthase MnmA [Dongiaceae bacterium]|jgi:tRNA-specific 2-thiouridylase|nr:tRNA 2-thiouridine(34) synthase MnmA [Dongiaceae bacterium]